MPISNIKDWREELREYFDKTLKAKKPTMKNLDRELIVNFVSNLLQDRNREIIEKIEEIEVSCVDNRLLGRTDEYLDGYKTSTERWREKRDYIITTLTGEDNE